MFGFIFRKEYGMIDDYKRLSLDRKLKINLFFSFLYPVLFLLVLTYILLYVHFSVMEITLLDPFRLFDTGFLGLIYDNLKTLRKELQYTWMVLAIALFIFFKWINPLLKKLVAFFAKSAIQASLNKQNAIQSAKNQKIYEENALKAHQKKVRETKELEKAKAEGQAEAMLSLYKGQLSLLQDHKKRGVDIEKETFDLRKKLLELESEENEKMINDLLRTLDRI